MIKDHGYNYFRGAVKVIEHNQGLADDVVMLLWDIAAGREKGSDKDGFGGPCFDDVDAAHLLTFKWQDTPAFHALKKEYEDWRDAWVASKAPIFFMWGPTKEEAVQLCKDLGVSL